MELYQLECFRVLCKHGNFTSASEELAVTQPAVSMAVKKLEDEFGAALINREDKGFRLTRAGEIVLRHAILIHNETTAIRQELGANVAKTREVIRLAAPLTMCAGFLPGLISDFVAEHPDVSLHLLQMGHAAIAEGLANRTLEIGILSKDMVNPLLQYRDYVKVEIVAAFAPEHRFNGAESVTPEMLMDETLIFSRSPNKVPGYIRRYFSELGIVKPRCVFHNVMPAGCAQIARRGTGVALVTQSVAGENWAPLSPPLFCQLTVAWNKKETPTEEMKTLIDFFVPPDL